MSNFTRMESLWLNPDYDWTHKRWYDDSDEDERMSKADVEKEIDRWIENGTALEDFIMEHSDEAIADKVEEEGVNELGYIRTVMPEEEAYRHLLRYVGEEYDEEIYDYLKEIW